jgi:hypothetical protein
VGLSGLEPETSSLSVTRSNQLSYSPNNKFSICSDAKLPGSLQNSVAYFVG